MEQKFEQNESQSEKQKQSEDVEAKDPPKLPPYHTMPLYPVPTESVVADIDKLCSLPIVNITHASANSVSYATYYWLKALHASNNYFVSTANLPRCYFPALITAPTGSGKTQFAIKDLASVAAMENRDILLIVNRKILREQLVQMTEEHFWVIPQATATKKKALPALGILLSALISSLLGTSKKSLKNLSIILKHHTAA